MRKRLENLLSEKLREYDEAVRHNRTAGVAWPDPLARDTALLQLTIEQARSALASLRDGHREPGRSMLISLGLLKPRRLVAEAASWSPRRRFERSAAEPPAWHDDYYSPDPLTPDT